MLGPVADETRAQRAMIHLILGETEEARQLVDAIDMSQQKEAKARATVAAIVGEAWARSGQAKRAVELLETIDLDDGDLRRPPPAAPPRARLRLRVGQRHQADEAGAPPPRAD